MYSAIEQFAHGHLDVGADNAVYWETSGNPRGKPALYLHGGPGSGLGLGGYRRQFDPEVYLIVGMDQRGCGRSRPLAVNALDGLDQNTTAALIDDIERLREHLDVEQWLVSGVSWGATLALAYAQVKPTHVSEIVLAAVTTTSREEADWITTGVSRLFPEAWKQFERHSQRAPGERVVDAYARRLRGPDADERQTAADAWDAWESTHVSLDPNWVAGPSSRSAEERTNFATLVTHYWSQDGFLADDTAILANMGSIAHIPGVLIHGRHDISGPMITPWRLHRQWPASELIVIESEGHGGPLMMDRMRIALDRFA